MYELKIDELNKIIEKEEPEGVDFFLMADERPYNGIESHRAAILFAIHLVNENEKQTINWRFIIGSISALYYGIMQLN